MFCLPLLRSIDTREKYPYSLTNDDDNCDYADARVTGFYNKWHTTEAEMKELVYIAPVATTVYVSCQV